jgi:hypothetical protein
MPSDEIRRLRVLLRTFVQRAAENAACDLVIRIRRVDKHVVQLKIPGIPSLVFQLPMSEIDLLLHSECIDARDAAWLQDVIRAIAGSIVESRDNRDCLITTERRRDLLLVGITTSHTDRFAYHL